MLMLSHTDLRAALDMPTCIEAMRRVFLDLAHGHYFVPLRGRAMPEGSPNWITWMPVLRTSSPRRWALKQMVVTPANSELRGLDPIQGIVVLQDGDDGRIIAIADAPILTTLRTAAVSALATRALARADSCVVAIIGTGIQGRSHIEALRCVLPQAAIRLWGRTPENARRLAEEAGCEQAASIEEAVRDADVVCTVTASLEPIIRREWLKPGCHVNAVGSSRPVARELDAATIKAASLFVDRRESALREAGEIVAALREGAITPSHIQAELGEVLSGQLPGRRSPDEFTLYKSLGLGAQDLGALEAAVDSARRLGRGAQVPW